MERIRLFGTISAIYPELLGHVSLFIIDNGSELDPDIGFENVLVFHNVNRGGSGGFNKGLEEIAEHGRYAHVIFEDDDARIHPESIYRTFAFLSYMSEHHQNTVLGGTLMNTVDGTIREAGATFRSMGTDMPKVRSLKKGLDVSDASGCLVFDINATCDYNGWWYCVYLVEFANPSNPVWQVFMRYDDVEYGLRLKLPVIHLNGICVWHEDYSKKNNPMTIYYDVRNHLMLTRRIGVFKKSDERKMIRRAIEYSFKGQSAESTAVLDAVRDSRHFFKELEKAATLYIQSCSTPLIKRLYRALLYYL